MTERREFLDTIGYYRRRIHLADFLDKLASALLIGAGAGVMLQAAAFLLPFYQANLCTVLALLLAAGAALAASLIRRCTMKQAALVMDGFGFQERIVTAYECLGQEGELIELQREDAMRRLQAEKGRIRIGLCPKRRKLALLACLAVLLPALILIPSPVKELAKELHRLGQEVKEKIDEIEEVQKELEALEEQGGQELTEEQLAALREMMDSLTSSISEYRQAVSAEALAAAGTKLDFKYGEMGGELSRMAAGLQGGAAVAQALGEMGRELQGMSGMPAGSLASAGDGSQGGSGQPGQGSGDGDSQGSGSGDGSGSGTGSGSGNSQGSGSGDGSGSGTGSGSGNGQGTGGGRGTGSSDAVHDYVSVPNAIADSDSLTGKPGGHEGSEYFRAQNGLSWEGEHVSHEAVIGSYQERAYEGVAAGRYPDGMENVIKDYFSSF